MRSFISLIILALIFSCQNPKKSTPDAEPFFKMSLAQWSFNKNFRSGGVSLMSLQDSQVNWVSKALNMLTNSTQTLWIVRTSQLP